MTIERREYTRKEIAENDGNNGARCWIIVHGIVYDVTDYLDNHPGGAELITEWAGGDATEGFEDFGHSNDAKRMLRKYEIGTVASSDNGNAKTTNYVNNNNNANVTSKRQRTRQRRKFLSTILGPCAMRL